MIIPTKSTNAKKIYFKPTYMALAIIALVVVINKPETNNKKDFSKASQSNSSIFKKRENFSSSFQIAPIFTGV